MRHHGKARDENEPEIVRKLEKDGFSVTRIVETIPAGFPDLHYARNGRAGLLEVKRPGGQLTPPQQRWRKLNNGPLVPIVTTPEEAIEEALRVVTRGEVHGDYDD